MNKKHRRGWGEADQLGQRTALCQWKIHQRINRIQSITCCEHTTGTITQLPASMQSSSVWGCLSIIHFAMTVTDWFLVWNGYSRIKFKKKEKEKARRSNSYGLEICSILQKSPLFWHRVSTRQLLCVRCLMPLTAAYVPLEVHRLEALLGQPDCYLLPFPHFYLSIFCE